MIHKRLLIAATTLSVASFVLHADKFEIDGIKYETNSDKSAVFISKYNVKGTQSGTLELRDSVSYKNKKYPVEGIGKNAFKKAQLGKVRLGSNMKYIKEGAFRESTVSDIDLCLVYTIGEWAFAQCPNLTTLLIPFSVEEIERGAFAGDKIKVLLIQDGDQSLKLGSNGYVGEGMFHDAQLQDLYKGRKFEYDVHPFNKETFQKQIRRFGIREKVAAPNTTFFAKNGIVMFNAGEGLFIPPVPFAYEVFDEAAKKSEKEILEAEAERLKQRMSEVGASCPEALPWYDAVEEIMEKMEKNEAVTLGNPYSEPSFKERPKDNIKQNGNTYTYKYDWNAGPMNYNSQYWPRCSGGLEMPEASITFTLTPTTLKMVITEIVQTECEYSDSGKAIAPTDPFTFNFGCKTGSRKSSFLMFGKEFPFTSTCTHKNVVLKVLPTEYPPVKFTHTNTVTYNLTEIAQNNNTTVSNVLEAFWVMLLKDGTIPVGAPAPDTDRARTAKMIEKYWPADRYKLVYMLRSMQKKLLSPQKQTTTSGSRATKATGKKSGSKRRK